jgi:hypothetical protein
MRRDIVRIILIILTLNLFLASMALAPPGTVVSVDPSLIQDNQIKPGAQVMKSYPSTHNSTATVTSPTYAYDKIMTTCALASPQAGTSTSYYYFNLKTFNSTLTKQYISLDIKMNYSVTQWRGMHRILLLVGSKNQTLGPASSTNVTTPTLKTWNAIMEPNDGLWSQTDINNLVLRVDVRRSSSTGWCTFKEYEAWVSIPMDSFAVRISISDVTQLSLWQINLTYNPSVLQAVAVREGPFLKSVPGIPPYPAPGTTFATVNGSGWIQAMSVLQSYDYGGANGSGVLATFHFKAKAEGNSVLDYSLPQTYLLTWNGTVLVDIPSQKLPGFFQYLNGDSNNDGEVNAADLATFNQAYGSTPSSTNWNTYCDFNRDNKVIASDLHALGKHYGQT